MTISFDDLDTPLAPASVKAPTTSVAIIDRASIVNGGNAAAAAAACPSCKGSGRFVSYTGRVVGNCFKCKGAGKVSTAVAAAAKGKITKANNAAQWLNDNAAEVAYARKRAEKGNTFFASLLEKLAAHGSLTENQIAAVRKNMASDAEFFAAKKEAAAAAAPAIDNISAVQALFDRAEVKLVKKPVFRTVEITISQAPASGKNPGALYVKTTKGGEYAGKIVGGRFFKSGSVDVTEALRAVAVDPTAEAIKYASVHGACCCCGKTLRNPVSVLAVVGPVCGPRWGLDWRRMAAEELLAEEAEEAEEAK